MIVAVAARLVITETRGPRHPLDVRGLVLACGGCLALAWGLVRSADRGWGDPSSGSRSPPGRRLVIAFVAAEHHASFPLVPPSLFRVRSFSAVNGVSVCIYASLSGSVYLMSQFFQLAQHASPLVAALRFVPWPAPGLVIAPLAGAWAGKLGNRPFLVVGMMLHAIALVWFALVVDAYTEYLALCGPLVLSGSASPASSRPCRMRSSPRCRPSAWASPPASTAAFASSAASLGVGARGRPSSPTTAATTPPRPSPRDSSTPSGPAPLLSGLGVIAALLAAPRAARAHTPAAECSRVGSVGGHSLDAGPALPASLLQDRQKSLGDR